MVRGLAALGVVRATFHLDGHLTSFEIGHGFGPEAIPTEPPPPDPEDDITAAANRLMGRR